MSEQRVREPEAGGCPVCNDGEECPGSHCLVELRDVCAFIRARGEPGSLTRTKGDQFADAVFLHFAPEGYEP